LAVTLILTIITIFIFHEFIAPTVSLSKLIQQATEIIISVGFLVAAVIIIRRFRPLMAQRIGFQATLIIQYIMLGLTLLVMVFGILNILQFSATALLEGAGIISITVGLVISTFVGSLLSGFLVFTTQQFKVGDNVIVNSVPGRVSEISALVMRIQTDVGQITIPNSAIAAGSVIITSLSKLETFSEGRLYYKVGDRVITSYMNEQGVVTKLTPLHTTILLDSGKEITFLNSTVLSGAVSMAKISQPSSEKGKN